MKNRKNAIKFVISSSFAFTFLLSNVSYADAADDLLKELEIQKQQSLTPKKVIPKNTVPRRIEPQKTIPKQNHKSTPRQSSNSTDIELSFWDSIKNSQNSDDFRAYLDKYPNGQFTSLARNRLNSLDSSQSNKVFGQKRVEFYRILSTPIFLSNRQEDLAAYHHAIEVNDYNIDSWNQLNNLLHLVSELDKKVADYQKTLASAQKDQNQQAIAIADGNLGVMYKTRADLDKAIEMYNNTLNLSDRQTIINSYGNLETAYNTRNDLDKSLEFQQKSLQINTTIGNKKEIANNYSELGFVYYARSEMDKAVEMYKKSLAITEEMGDKQNMAIIYTNLGRVYQERSELNKAVEFYEDALEIAEGLGLKEIMANDYSNLGVVYQTRSDLDKAIEFYEKSLAIAETLGLKKIMANNYSNIGFVYKIKNNKAEARRYYQKSLDVLKQLNSPDEKLVQSWLDAL
jgi:tetratricopeptide (TPR) repeat protein